MKLLNVVLGVIIVLQANVVSAQAIIKTIAGTGTAGYSGDGGLANVARLNRPNSLCIDKSGNIYFTDAFNHVARKIAPDGIISTVAGTGSPGFSGDGGLATSAMLFIPQGIALDTGENNLFISDGGNNRIRKVSLTTGNITTVAGTGIAGDSGDGSAGTSAQLAGPLALYVDKFNKLDISDYDNHRIRQLDLNTGIIFAFAGTGISGYSGDSGLAVNASISSATGISGDNDGNIYFSDHWNSVIRKVLPSKIIVTIAGTGVYGYSGDGGPALNAQFFEPGGLFVDRFNNIFIADYRNGAIRKISGGTGIIETIVGGEAGYGGDNGAVLDAKLKCTDVRQYEGQLYISDYVNNRIRKTENLTSIKSVNRVSGEVYPNPSNGVFYLRTSLNYPLEAVLYDIGGSIVGRKQIKYSSEQFDFSQLTDGVYSLFLINESGSFLTQVVIGK